MPARSSGSVTTSQCQPCRLPPVGACSATSRHSFTSSSGTGRVRSRRLRTERVVVSSSSGESGSVVTGHTFPQRSTTNTADSPAPGGRTSRPARYWANAGAARESGPITAAAFTGDRP